MLGSIFILIRAINYSMLTNSHVFQRAGCQFSHLFFISIIIISKLHWSIQVGWWINVWIVHHRNNTNKDCLHTQNWSPSFLCFFLRIHAINSWGMQDRNAYFSICVNIWMPHFSFECHWWRIIWIIIWKL